MGVRLADICYFFACSHKKLPMFRTLIVASLVLGAFCAPLPYLEEIPDSEVYEEVVEMNILGVALHKVGHAAGQVGHLAKKGVGAAVHTAKSGAGAAVHAAKSGAGAVGHVAGKGLNAAKSGVNKVNPTHHAAPHHPAPKPAPHHAPPHHAP